MLEFSKAFDCVDHELLLSKLERPGVSGQANKSFKSNLETPTWIVEIKL